MAIMIVDLIKLGGDGVDFDWEHMSQDPTKADQLRKTMASVLLKTRETLDAAGLTDAKIGYTTRFNAFWDNDTRPEGFKVFASDGEGLSIDAEMKAKAGKSLSDVVDWINIMMYDTAPTDIGGKATGLELDQYELVLDHFAKSEHKDKIVMGFEPGYQASGGLWEGTKVDEQVVDYV